MRRSANRTGTSSAGADGSVRLVSIGIYRDDDIRMLDEAEGKT
jgi:hypothetical protein